MPVISNFPDTKDISVGKGLLMKGSEISIKTPVIGMTQAEYDALSDAERKNGLYVITDAKGSVAEGNADPGALYLQVHGINDKKPPAIYLQEEAGYAEDVEADEEAEAEEEAEEGEVEEAEAEEGEFVEEAEGYEEDELSADSGESSSDNINEEDYAGEYDESTDIEEDSAESFADLKFSLRCPDSSLVRLSIGNPIDANDATTKDYVDKKVTDIKGLTKEDADGLYMGRLGGAVHSDGTGENLESIQFTSHIDGSEDKAEISVSPGGAILLAGSLPSNESENSYASVSASIQDDGSNMPTAEAALEAQNFQNMASVRLLPGQIRLISQREGPAEYGGTLLISRENEDSLPEMSLSLTKEQFKVTARNETWPDGVSFCFDGEQGLTVGDSQIANMDWVTELLNQHREEIESDISAWFPRGIITMWSGAASAIPFGWALCNGQNGTPDLRDRFVVGAGSSYAVGAKGGEASHTLTVEEMPRHSHSVSSLSSTSSGSLPVGSGGSRLENSSKTTVATGGNAAHNNLPPYYALCYIMKL